MYVCTNVCVYVYMYVCVRAVGKELLKILEDMDFRGGGRGPKGDLGVEFCFV